MRYEERFYFAVSILVAGLIMSLYVIYSAYMLYFTPADIKIGVFVPLEGDSKYLGDNLIRGVELAIPNKSREHFDIEYYHLDCKSEITSELNEALNKNFSAIIGGACFNGAEILMKTGEARKIPTVIVGSSTSNFGSGSSYIFSTIPNNEIEGNYTAGLIRSQNNSKLAILYVNNKFGSELRRIVKNDFENDGGSIVAQESFSSPEEVERSVLKIKWFNPDAIYIISEDKNDSESVISAVDKFKINSKIYTNFGFAYPEIIQNESSSNYTLIIPPTGNSDFKKLYSINYGSSPKVLSAQGYDGAKFVYNSYKEGAINPEYMLQKLEKIKIESSNGKIGFSNHKLSGVYESYVIKDLR